MEVIKTMNTNKLSYSKSSGKSKVAKLLEYAVRFIKFAYNKVVDFFCSTLLINRKVTSEYESWCGEWYSIIGEIKKNFDSYQIRNVDEYSQTLPTPYNKFLRVFHNHNGCVDICQIHLQQDKTMVVRFMRGNDEITESHYEFNTIPKENIINKIVETVLTIEGYGDVAAKR